MKRPVFYCILLSEFLGGYIDCKNIHGMRYIKFL
jgi:hypothetical protein